MKAIPELSARIDELEDITARQEEQREEMADLIEDLRE